MPSEHGSREATEQDRLQAARTEVRETLRQQACALNRIQATLQILVEALMPQLADKLDGQKIPVAMRIAGDGETPDVASAVLVADPIGA